MSASRENEMGKYLWSGLLAACLAACASQAGAQGRELYAYDALGRLTTSSQTSGNNARYAYDAAGNRILAVNEQSVFNPGFVLDHAGWEMLSWLAPSAMVGVNNSLYWGNGNNVLWSYIPGQPSNALVDVRSGWLPIVAGQTYEISVYAAQHRGTAQALAEFYAADKATLVATVPLAGVGQEGGAANGDLTNFNRIGSILEAPVGSAYGRLNLRLASNGGADPFAFFTRPSLSSATAIQDVVNPRFLYGAQRWELQTFNTSTYLLGVNLENWSGSGNDVVWMYMPGTPANALMDLRSNFMPSVPGARYEVSVAAAQHRAASYLLVEFYAADKATLLSQTLIPGQGRDYGSAHGDTATFNILGGFVTAPANAAYRRLNLRLASTGGPEPYAFFTRPISREATPGQQMLTVWSQ